MDFTWQLGSPSDGAGRGDGLAVAERLQVPVNVGAALGALQASVLRVLLVDFVSFYRNGSLHAELQITNTLGVGADSCRG